MPTDATTGEQITDPDERAGARTFAEHDDVDARKSRSARWAKKGLREGENLLDTAKAVGKVSQSLVVRPTGQAIQKPSGPAISAVKDPYAGPDLLASIAVMAVVAIHWAGLGINELREWRASRSGNNG